MPYPVPSSGGGLPYPTSMSASQPPYSSSASQPPAHTPVQAQQSFGQSTLQPEMIRPSLLSAIEDKLRNRLPEIIGASSRFSYERRITAKCLLQA